MSTAADQLDIGKYVQKNGPYYDKMGEYSDVWVGEYEVTGGTKLGVAIKVLRGAPAQNHEVIDKLMERLRTDGQKWRSFDHPNICKFYGFSYEFGYMPALVLDFHQNGNVMEYLKKTPEANRMNIIIDVASGLEYLHACGILHGDLRGFNVLAKTGGSVCLADYGLLFIVEQADFTRHKIAGPARWAAPEVLDPPANVAPHSEATDVYAFAMTVVEIYTGSAPFSERRNDSAVIVQVLSGSRPTLPAALGEKDDMRQLLEACWDEDPKKRPSAQAVRSTLEDFRMAGESPSSPGPGADPPPGWWSSAASYASRLMSGLARPR